MTSQPAQKLISNFFSSVAWFNIKKYFNKIVFIILALSGARGLYVTIIDIFWVYPKLADYYRQLNFDPSIHHQLITNAIYASVSSFTETAFGTSMLFKKTHTIKVLHTLAGILLFIASYYLKAKGAIPNLEAIKEATSVFLP